MTYLSKALSLPMKLLFALGTVLTAAAHFSVSYWDFRERAVQFSRIDALFYGMRPNLMLLPGALVFLLCLNRAVEPRFAADFLSRYPTRGRFFWGQLALALQFAALTAVLEVSAGFCTAAFWPLPVSNWTTPGSYFEAVTGAAAASEPVLPLFWGWFVLSRLLYFFLLAVLLLCCKCILNASWAGFLLALAFLVLEAGLQELPNVFVLDWITPTYRLMLQPLALAAGTLCFLLLLAALSALGRFALERRDLL